MKGNYTMENNINISIIFFILLTSCNYFKNKKAEKKMEEYTEYKDLHEHQGTENYEIIALYDKNSTISKKLIDKTQNVLYISGWNEKIDEGYLTKVNFFGGDIKKNEVEGIIQDGTLFDKKYSSNWFLDGDITKHKYIDPFTNKEIEDVYELKNIETNYKKWLEQFEKCYTKATYVYLDGYDYYFKIKNKWYLVKTFKVAKENVLDIRKKYPAKINPEEIRMAALPEVFDNLLENKILQLPEYIEMDSKKSSGLSPISFSSGYYMFELHLPQGDVLKFRRYGAMGFNADMNIYQIPEELGGSNEVFFIEQLPRQTYPNKSFAGFYAIRPKNYKELPEYKKHLENKKSEKLKEKWNFTNNK